MPYRATLCKLNLGSNYDSESTFYDVLLFPCAAGDADYDIYDNDGDVDDLVEDSGQLEATTFLAIREMWNC